MKCFLTMILAFMVLTSCVEDEFGNVVGSWLYPQSQEIELYKTSTMPPEDCEKNITFNFDKNLTGTLVNETCDSTSDIYSFRYNLKAGTMTIVYEDELPDNLDVIFGINTYIISGNELIITDMGGTITVLTRI